MSEPTRSKVAVVVFTDIVGSTALKSRFGNPGYTSLLVKHDRLFESVVHSIDGAQIHKNTGDGFMTLFPTPSAAVEAMLRFNVLLWNAPWCKDLDPPFRVRIGIHIGEVDELTDSQGRVDYFGIAVDLASRLQCLAKAGQILVTQQVFNDARQYVRQLRWAGEHTAPANLRWLDHGPYQFKGIDKLLNVFEVGIEGISPLCAPDNSAHAHRAIVPGEEEFYGWRPAVGTQIPDYTHWVLDRKLGEGGFGEVWLAHHERLKSRCVFKFCFKAERVRSLKREMKLFELLRENLHDRPDIAKVFHVHLDQPPYFLQCEFTDRGDLRTWADSHGGIDKVPVPTRLSLVEQTAEAVAAAHGVGVIHGDIKPSNILIFEGGPDGSPRPKLSDFGIGRMSECCCRKPSGDITSVATDQSLNNSGTPMYAAPELLQNGRTCTEKSDVYALGVLLYQMAVGDLHRPLATGWERHVKDRPLREDIRWCVEGDPARRLGDAHALAQRLRKLHARRFSYRLNRALAACALIAALAWVIVSGYDSLQRRREIMSRQAAQHGTELMINGQLVKALPYWVTALEGEASVPRSREAQMLRTQIATTIRQIPCPISVLREAGQPKTLLKTGMGIEVTAPGDGSGLWLAAAGGALSPPSVKHSDSIHYAEFSPNGLWFVTVSEDLTACVWDVRTGAAVTPPLVHDRGGRKWAVKCASFSPDGKRLATGGADRVARVWQVPNGTLVTVTPEHGKWITSVSFSPDGQNLLIAGGEGSVHVFDLANSAMLCPPLRHPGWVPCARFSPDGHRVATACGDGNARLWALGQSESTPVIFGHEERRWVHDVCFSPDGKLLATAGGDATAKLWDTQTGRLTCPPLRHRKAVRSVRFSSDGSFLVTASDDGTAQIWDVKTGRQKVTMPMKHEDEVWSAAFSPDGELVVTASKDGTARVWDARTAKQITPPLQNDGRQPHGQSANSDWGDPYGMKQACFSPDGTQILTVSANHSAYLWNITPTDWTIEHLRSLAYAVSGIRASISPQTYEPFEEPLDEDELRDIFAGLINTFPSTDVGTMANSPVDTRLISADHQNPQRPLAASSR